MRVRLSPLTPHSSLLTLFLLAACAGTSPPDWQLNAVSALDAHERRWLEGDSAQAALSFERARAEIARTGRLDLAARAELIRCAAQVAALDFGPCREYERLAAHASPEDAAYARLLAGDWQGLEAKWLPAHYSGLIGARDEAERNRAAQAIAAPYPRLIAAALLLRAGQASPQTLEQAAQTASEQGWRRPLLGWLNVLLKRAEALGHEIETARLRQRIELVYSSKPGLAP